MANQCSYNDILTILGHADSDVTALSIAKATVSVATDEVAERLALIGRVEDSVYENDGSYSFTVYYDLTNCEVLW